MNNQISELRNMENYSEYKEKYETMTVEYEKEKERLTKLYHLYEETDSECKKLSEENKSWQNWYNSNKEIFNKLFASVPSEKTTDTPIDNSPNIPEAPENPTKRKSKKKLRLKK